MTDLLFLGLPGVLLEKPLKQIFPNVSIYAVAEEAIVGDVIEKVEIIDTFKIGALPEFAGDIQKSTKKGLATVAG